MDNITALSVIVGAIIIPLLSFVAAQVGAGRQYAQQKKELTIKEKETKQQIEDALWQRVKVENARLIKMVEGLEAEVAELRAENNKLKLENAHKDRQIANLKGRLRKLETGPLPPLKES